MTGLAFGGSTWWAAAARGEDAASGTDLWREPMLAVTLVLGVTSILLLVAMLSRARQFRAVLLVAAAGGLLIAAVVQPGSISAVSMALGVLGASMILGRRPSETVTA